MTTIRCGGNSRDLRQDEIACNAQNAFHRWNSGILLRMSVFLSLIRARNQNVPVRSLMSSDHLPDPVPGPALRERVGGQPTRPRDGSSNSPPFISSCSIYQALIDLAERNSGRSRGGRHA